MDTIKSFARIFSRHQPAWLGLGAREFVPSEALRAMIGAKLPASAGIGGSAIARISSLLARPHMAVAFVIALIALSLLPIEGRPLASQGVQSVLEMMGLRSPGARGEGRLIDSKLARARAAPGQRALGKTANPPSERALGKIFPATAAPIGDIPFSAPFEPNLLDVASLPAIAPDGPFGGGGGGGGGGGDAVDGGGGIPGGGGGNGGGLPGGGNPGGAAPPVAAVPEPGTWLMMIIAFGSCGYMLRRRRRVAAMTSSCKSAG